MPFIRLPYSSRCNWGVVGLCWCVIGVVKQDVAEMMIGFAFCFNWWGRA